MHFVTIIITIRPNKQEHSFGKQFKHKWLPFASKIKFICQSGNMSEFQSWALFFNNVSEMLLHLWVKVK